MFYLYILFSESAQRYYVGHSETPHERLVEHNANETEKYTGKYADWKMVALFKVGPDKAVALSLGKFINGQKSKKLLLKLVDPNFVPADKLAQLVRVPLAGE